MDREKREQHRNENDETVELTDEELEKLEEEHAREEEDTPDQDEALDPASLRAKGRSYYGGEQAQF